MKKWILWFLALSLLLPALPGSARADEAPQSPIWSLDAQWELSPDGKSLVCGDLTYHWYPLPAGNYLHPTLLLKHEVEIPIREDYSLFVFTAEGNADLIFLSDRYSYSDPIRIYATEAGIQYLDRWSRGYYAKLTLLDKDPSPDLQAPLSESFVSQLDTAPITAQVDATTLRNIPTYSIMGHDESRILQHPHGEIYLCHDGYYYVNLDALDNTCFDADGKLSYRSGTIPMAKLDEALIREIDLAVSAMAEDTFSTEYLDTYLGDHQEKPKNVFLVNTIFIVLSLLLGFLLPAALLIVALVKALSKKAAGRRRWYLLMTLASVWIGYALYILISLFTAAG